MGEFDQSPELDLTEVLKRVEHAEHTGAYAEAALLYDKYTHLFPTPQAEVATAVCWMQELELKNAQQALSAASSRRPYPLPDTLQISRVAAMLHAHDFVEPWQTIRDTLDYNIILLTDAHAALGGSESGTELDLQHQALGRLYAQIGEYEAAKASFTHITDRVGAHPLHVAGAYIDLLRLPKASNSETLLAKAYWHLSGAQGHPAQPRELLRAGLCAANVLEGYETPSESEIADLLPGLSFKAQLFLRHEARAFQVHPSSTRPRY